MDVLKCPEEYEETIEVARDKNKAIELAKKFIKKNYKLKEETR